MRERAETPVEVAASCDPWRRAGVPKVSGLFEGEVRLAGTRDLPLEDISIDKRGPLRVSEASPQDALAALGQRAASPATLIFPNVFGN